MQFKYLNQGIINIFHLFLFMHQLALLFFVICQPEKH